MDVQKVKEQSEREWKNESESNIVMRTACFSSDQQHLEVCGQRKDNKVPGKESRTERRRGLHDYVIVPLGLMSVMRRQVRMEKRLLDNCRYH
jgi:hypothetical protein